MFTTRFSIKALMASGVLLVGTMLSVSASCQEVQPYFASIGYSQFDYTDTNTDQDAQLDVVVLRLGQNFSRYFSGELRAGFGSRKDALGNSGQSLEVDHFYGIYTKAGLPIADMAFPYLAIGVTETEVSIYQGEAETQDSLGGFSYGLGADFKITDNLELNVEYMSHFDKNNEQIRGLQFTISAPFND